MNPQPYIAEQLISHRYADLVREARAGDLAALAGRRRFHARARRALFGLFQSSARRGYRSRAETTREAAELHLFS
jgi:hypothetical protein